MLRTFCAFGTGVFAKAIFGQNDHMNKIKTISKLLSAGIDVFKRLAIQQVLIGVQVEDNDDKNGRDQWTTEELKVMKILNMTNIRN